MQSVGVDATRAISLGSRRFSLTLGDGLTFGDSMFGLLGSTSVLGSQFALTLSRLAIFGHAGDRLLGARLVSVGLCDASARLDASLGQAAIAASFDRWQGQKGEHDQRGNDDEHDQPRIHPDRLPHSLRGYATAMHSVDIDTALAWRGRTVRAPGGEKVGTLGDVFLDDESSQPAWVGVRTGLFGRHESFVPIESVSLGDDDDLRVPFSEEQIKEAPRIDPDVTLTTAEEAALWRHYGRDYVHLRDPAPPPSSTSNTPLGDDAMTRSEEEVRVGQGPMRPTERVRLRKVMVTEHQQRTIPVRKEVIQLETEPVPEGAVEEPLAPGDELPDQSH